MGDEKKMGKRHKQIYLITGTEGGWKWRLSFPVSQKQLKWLGSFDFTEIKKLHTQKTIHLLGGVVKGCEWQLSINVSDGQEKWRANFYFKPALPAPSPNPFQRKGKISAKVEDGRAPHPAQ